MDAAEERAARLAGGAADLGGVSGKAVKLRFSVKAVRLYAFWVSPERSGISRGYVAAGGPGFTSAVDR